MMLHQLEELNRILGVADEAFGPSSTANTT